MVMARIYTECEMYEAAIAEIEYLLSLESFFTVYSFSLNEIFEPLHDLPEFQALMEKYKHDVSASS